MTQFTVSQHFVGKEPVVKSIHLVNKSAFAGIATQKAALVLNIKSASPITDVRIRKSEKISASRFHQEVKLTSPAEVDDLLIGWLKEAYLLSG